MILLAIDLLNNMMRDAGVRINGEDGNRKILLE
jgi:hypothetical protein